jgi:hypothetical protein
MTLGLSVSWFMCLGLCASRVSVSLCVVFVRACQKGQGKVGGGEGAGGRDRVGGCAEERVCRRKGEGKAGGKRERGRMT